MTPKEYFETASVVDVSCDACGVDDGEGLVRISDCDPSVGYHGWLDVCKSCAKLAVKGRCGSCV